MEEYIFSYDNYRKLLHQIKQVGNVCDYRDVTEETKEFILLRHDVEFSPERALKLAQVEAEEGVKSTYFFQLTNNAYNLLSARNKEIIRTIREDLHHHVGLHFHLNGMTDVEEIKRRISYEIELMSQEMGYKVDRFSFHRPSQLVLENLIEIPGIINAYHPLYFNYNPNVSELTAQNIKYIADSRNKWSYIEPWSAPCEEFWNTYRRVQVLCHPYSWTEKGYTTLGNLQSMIEEKKEEFIETMCNETVYIKEYRNEL